MRNVAMQTQIWEYESSDDEESNDASDNYNWAGNMLIYVMQINVHMATHVFCICWFASIINSIDKQVFP